MVFIKDNSIIIECDCNTHSIKLVKGDENEYYLNEYVHTFYSKQDKTFFNKLKFKLKYIWYILRGKDYLLEEVCLTHKDMTEIIDGVKAIMNFKNDEE